MNWRHSQNFATVESLIPVRHPFCQTQRRERYHRWSYFGRVFTTRLQSRFSQMLSTNFSELRKRCCHGNSGQGDASTQPHMRSSVPKLQELRNAVLKWKMQFATKMCLQCIFFQTCSLCQGHKNTLLLPVSPQRPRRGVNNEEVLPLTDTFGMFRTRTQPHRFFLNIRGVQGPNPYVVVSLSLLIVPWSYGCNMTLKVAAALRNHRRQSIGPDDSEAHCSSRWCVARNTVTQS